MPRNEGRKKAVFPGEVKKNRCFGNIVYTKRKESGRWKNESVWMEAGHKIS